MSGIDFVREKICVQSVCKRERERERERERMEMLGLFFAER